MCIFTYLSDSEINKSTSNEEINELMVEVRRITREDFQVIEREFETKSWFQPKKIKKYELLVKSCMGDYQVINFYREHSNSSIGIMNEADLVIAFLQGVLAGAHYVCNKS